MLLDAAIEKSVNFLIMRCQGASSVLCMEKCFFLFTIGTVILTGLEKRTCLTWGQKKNKRGFQSHFYDDYLRRIELIKILKSELPQFHAIGGSLHIFDFPH